MFEVAPPQDIPSNLVKPNLVNRGLASPSENGLISTDTAFQTLAALQTSARQRKMPKSVTGAAKNVSWQGVVLIKLAEILASEIGKGADINKVSTQLDIYRLLRANEKNISINQVKGAISRIFGQASSVNQVWEAARAHKSYGDAWRALPEDERSRIIQLRRDAARAFWSEMTAEAKAERKQNTRHAQTEQFSRIANVESSEHRKIFNVSRELKDLEEGLLPGQCFTYPGVPEKMRSSWEALFASVINITPGRHYFYEPMGFPVILPGKNQVFAYHPDFFDFKFGSEHATGRVIEIKGQLTETAQAKILAFRKFYIDNDFSGLTTEQTALMKRFVTENKQLAFKQFGLTLTKSTPFLILGDLPWDYTQNKFYEAGTPARQGFIPRLRKRFPELQMHTEEPKISRSRAKEIANKISPGETLRLVNSAQGRSFIQRSDLATIDLGLQENLYLRSRVYAAALTYGYSEWTKCRHHPNEPLPVFPALIHLEMFIAHWHITDNPSKESMMAAIENTGIKRNRFWRVVNATNFLRDVQTDFTALLEHKAFSANPGQEGSAKQMLENINDLLNRLLAIELKIKKVRQVDPTDRLTQKLTKRCLEIYESFKIFSTNEKEIMDRLGIDLPFIRQQFTQTSIFDRGEMKHNRNANAELYMIDPELEELGFLCSEPMLNLPIIDKSLPVMPTGDGVFHVTESSRVTMEDFMKLASKVPLKLQRLAERVKSLLNI